MATGYIIVRNPLPRIIPQFFRAMLGESYMTINVFPNWSNHIKEAEVFLSPDIAGMYIRRFGGEVRPGFENTAIRKR